VDFRALFRFPNPVNETSARLVAAGVVVMSASAVVFGQRWLVAVIAGGFVARVLAGPRLSPLALVVTRLVTPRLRVHHRYVPGPPKRFAQGIGATITVAGVITWFGFGSPIVTSVLLAVLGVAATLESVFAICLGCLVFAELMRVGVIPETVCEECGSLRLDRGPARART
jgi:Domain of unknown function (DUF4395)